MANTRLFRRTSGGIFYACVYDANGQRHRFSTRCTDRKAAELVLQREERLAQSTPLYRSTLNRYSLQNAVDDLIEQGCLDCAPDTIKFYRIKAGHLLRLLGAEFNVAKFTPSIVREYIRARQEEGAKDNTILKEIITLRRTLKLAHEHGLLSADPADLVPRFRVRYEPRDRWLTAEEMKRLLGELRPHRQLWVLVAALAGARASEIERLRWEHVDLVRGWILLPGTKTAKSRRRVPLAPDLSEALRRVKQPLGVVVTRWLNVRRDLGAACARAKVPKVTANDLRRTFASWLKQAGNDSMVVAKLLGHSTTRMVELVYGHLSPNEYQTAIGDLPRLRGGA